MTGYAASARIRRAQVGSPHAHAAFIERPPDPVSRGQLGEGILEELEGASAWARLAELREDVATAWRQTTFFLFDPQSWR
jgi:hypothetical protein